MRIDETRAVGEIAATLPEAVPLLEELGIDYYIHGTRQLREACAAVGLDLAETVRLLEQVETADKRPKPIRHWSLSPLTELTNYLISHHHTRGRTDLARLLRLAQEARSIEEPTRPELKRIETLLRTLTRELDTHITSEEEHLFPQIEALEKAAVDRRDPEPPYTGGVHDCILVELHEHELLVEKMRKVRELSSNFLVPQSACPQYKELMRGLKLFERGLHAHLHLENNVLFPRAGELERTVSSGRRMSAVPVH
jgi:regulator of cell morphogenesis and NO signaling